jgi:hypothetical protein
MHPAADLRIAIQSKQAVQAVQAVQVVGSQMPKEQPLGFENVPFS